ncbi:lactate utilization protein C [Pontibacillus salicampi]|uniref:Lactate utilization protein C n=1 Tax=Pontibacillus salicampi TaxID=1449801 RepID=A0ABV6LKS1_9BACI
MTIQNRERFLNNVAQHLGRERKTKNVERPSSSLMPQWQVFQHHSQDELADELELQCHSIHTTCKRTNAENLHTVLQETIEELKGQRIIASDDSRNETFGISSLYEDLQKKGITCHIWNSADGQYNLDYAESADVGITFSDITLAESGTVTLFNNSGNGRAISLLPRSYIAIIPKSTLVPRMTQAAKHIHEAEQEGHGVASCVSFITGPSNSADIEMNLIVGVHGPVEVTYILVENR